MKENWLKRFALTRGMNNMISKDKLIEDPHKKYVLSKVVEIINNKN